MRGLCYDAIKKNRDGDEMATPKVSIIVPIYNVEQYIAECLDSILNQSQEELEVICVDDCGEDGSLAIVERYARVDSRIKLVAHQENRGLGQARNTGLVVSKGDYVSCVDSDDWLLPGMLEKCCEILDQSDLDSVWVKYTGDKGDWPHSAFFNALPGGALEVTVDNINMFPVTAWNKLYRREAVLRNGAHWSRRILYEDVEFFWRFYTHSPKTWLVDERLYVYRDRSSSIMNRSLAVGGGWEDIFVATRNVHDYLVESGNLERYGDAFLDLVAKNVDMFINIRGLEARTVELAAAMLAAIGFRERFKSCRSYTYLNGVVFSPSCRVVRKICQFFLRFIPVSSVRRRCRQRMRFYPAREKPRFN